MCVCRTLLRALPWRRSAAERHLSGWRRRLSTTASCLSQPGPSQTYHMVHLLFVVASLVQFRSPGHGEWKETDLVISTPASMQLPCRCPNQLLKKERNNKNSEETHFDQPVSVTSPKMLQKLKQNQAAGQFGLVSMCGNNLALLL